MCYVSGFVIPHITSACTAYVIHHSSTHLRIGSLSSEWQYVPSLHHMHLEHSIHVSVY